MEVRLKLSKANSTREKSCNSGIYWTSHNFFSGTENTPPLQSFKSRLDQAVEKHIARNTAVSARQ